MKESFQSEGLACSQGNAEQREAMQFFQPNKGLLTCAFYEKAIKAKKSDQQTYPRKGYGL
jgi:hypothetical protein